MITLLRRLLRLAPASDTPWSNEEITDFLAAPPTAMQEIRPQQASNDDPLTSIRESLERDLREAGLIR